MAKTEAYKFHVTYNYGTPQASRGPDITLNIPVYTYDQWVAFTEQLAPGGTGAIKLLDYNIGPTARWNNAVAAGFDPSHNTRLLGFFRTQYQSGTLDELVQTALYNYMGYGVDCFRYTAESPWFQPMLLWQDNSNDALMVNEYVDINYPGIKGELWRRPSVSAAFVKNAEAGEIPMFLGVGRKTRCGFIGFVDGAPGTAVRKIFECTTMYSYVSGDTGEFRNSSPWGFELYHPDSAPTLLKFFFSGARHEAFEYNADDPYQDGGTSSPGGGTGNFDNSSDPVPLPEKPVWSVMDTGLMSVFSPTREQLSGIATYLWSSAPGDVLNKLLANPFDAIISLHALPIDVPAGNAVEIDIAGLATGVNANVVTDQWVPVDCGSINVKEYWGGFMDYAPYTKIAIYLPYCGVFDLAVDDIMNRTVSVKYWVDILSGACIASIMADGVVLYQYNGNCRYDLPITAPDFRQLAQSMTALAASAITAPVAPIMSAGSLAASAQSIIASKTNVQRSGSLAGNTGVLAVQYPYLMITRPRQIIAGNQGDYVGFPSWITGTVGSFSGWTQFREVHLDNVPATDAELEELHDILTTGVII